MPTVGCLCTLLVSGGSTTFGSVLWELTPGEVNMELGEHVSWVLTASIFRKGGQASLSD